MTKLLLSGQIALMDLPIGTIISLWKLPEGWSDQWISCDGQTINQGPFKNQKAPELNKGQRFLRGGLPASAGSYQDQDTNMEKLQASYLDRYFVEGAYDDRIFCGEGTVDRWTDEYDFKHAMNNAACNVTRNIQFRGTDGETRPKNMAVLFYMKVA